MKIKASLAFWTRPYKGVVRKNVSNWMRFYFAKVIKFNGKQKEKGL